VSMQHYCKLATALLLCCSLTAPADGAELPPGDGLLAEANQAFSDANYNRAVALYTKILARDENQDTAYALEYLGLARERKNQLAHAKAIYSDYLQRYPEGEGHDRVNQRLQAVLSIGREPALRQIADKGRNSNSSAWQIYGSSSSTYRYADISIDRNGDRGFDRSDDYSTQSDLLSRLNMTVRTSGSEWGLETRVNAGYLHDFFDEDDPGGRHGDDVMLSQLSVEVGHKRSDTVLRAGRQYSSGDGVLGRFDGLRAEIPITANWQFNLVGGRPVDLVTNTSVDSSERWFYGGSVDYSPEDSDWDYTLFATEGRIDGMLDRQAVGGELRYFSDNNSLFTLVDYDTNYQQLNIFMLIGNLTLPTGTVLGATADYRQSPILTTRNALIGQPVDSIDDLGKLYSDDEIMQLAEDRTAESHNITLSLTQPLSEFSRLYFAVSEFEYGDTQTSGGVEGYEGTGGEYSYEVQLITGKLLQENDTHVFSLRYFDGTRTQRTGFGINSRVQLGDHWRLQPRIWVEYRDSPANGSSQWSIRPSVRMQYTWARRYHFELEYGRDWSTREIAELGDENISGNYFLSSYRVDFN
jgi:hypothetical protein